MRPGLGDRGIDYRSGERHHSDERQVWIVGGGEPPRQRRRNRANPCSPYSATAPARRQHQDIAIGRGGAAEPKEPHGIPPAERCVRPRDREAGHRPVRASGLLGPGQHQSASQGAPLTLADPGAHPRPADAAGPGQRRGEHPWQLSWSHPSRLSVGQAGS